MPTRRKSSAGSFNDEFERLLEGLAGSPQVEPGKPLLSEKGLPIIVPQTRIGRCRESHNRFLLDGHAWADESLR